MIHDITNFDHPLSSRRCLGKNLKATLLFIDFSKAFDSIHRRKMKQILFINGPHKETITAIMILCKNMKVKVHSLDGDSNYFDIVAGVLQGDTLAPYLFIICLDYVLRMSIDLTDEIKCSFSKQRLYYMDAPHGR